MRAFRGSFKKKNGEIRDMNFVKLQDLPEAFLSSLVKNTSPKRKLGEGMELVWDIDISDFRIFNFKAVVGGLTEYNYSGSISKNNATISEEDG